MMASQSDEGPSPRCSSPVDHSACSTPGPWLDHPTTSVPLYTSTPQRIAEESEEEDDLTVSASSQTDVNLAALLEVPILGYEIMEPRPKFTLQSLFPHFRLALPPKKWFGDNFDRAFLSERLSGLQAFLNAAVGHRDTCNSEPVREFLCIDDPPGPHDSIEESRALCDALEEQLYFMKQEIQAKDAKIGLLQDEVHIYREEVSQLRNALRNECEAYRELRSGPQLAHSINVVMLDMLERSMTRQSSGRPSESSLTEQEQIDENSDPEGSETQNGYSDEPITSKETSDEPITDSDTSDKEIAEKNGLDKDGMHYNVNADQVTAVPLAT